jgi:hypothetical protein
MRSVTNEMATLSFCHNFKFVNAFQILIDSRKKLSKCKVRITVFGKYHICLRQEKETAMG